MNPDTIHCTACGKQCTHETAVIPCDCEEGIALCKRDWEFRYPKRCGEYTCEFCGKTKTYETSRVISYEKLRNVFLFSTVIVDLFALFVLIFVTTYSDRSRDSYLVCLAVYAPISLIIFICVHGINGDLRENNTDPDSTLALKIFRDPLTETFSFVYRLIIYLLILTTTTCTMLLGAFCRIYIMRYHEPNLFVLSLTNLKSGGIAIGILTTSVVAIILIPLTIYIGAVKMCTDTRVRFIQMKEEV